MASIVVGALLSASVELLLEKVVSGDFVNFSRRTKLDVSLLEKLNITLLSLQAVLYDAEEKQITNPAVKKWLVMLQDAVFEADNLFDEINTEALKRKVETEYEGKTLNAKVHNIFYSGFKLFNRKINSKMQILLERLECLRQQNLGLKEGVSSDVLHGTPTYSFVGDESSICGRDDDRKKLKDLLLSEDGSDGGSKIGVISIVGMGGLGKTTLAKLLYNDHEVKEKFELRGWAHISKDFDVFNITKTLLDSVTSKTINNCNQKSLHLEPVNTKENDSCDLNTLQLQLQQCLSNKTFLLVLDDIWYGRYVGWNNLNDIFNVGGMRSKIIITTRDERVALPMQTFFSVHHLKPLESEDCWSLLARHAFVASNYQERSYLEVVGKEIANKCKGLPLAAIALGGLLRIKLSQDYWNDVLKSSIWELTDDEVQPALLLSYRYLPVPLKGCFAYCSIFPKNSFLEKKMVVQLWIAEGLVVYPQSEKRWEKVAEEYFDELVSRSLIHRRSVDGEERFEMHDLINDLATMVSSPNCMRMEEFNPQESLERVRHLSYNRGLYDSYHKFVKLYGLTALRSFLPFPLQDRRPNCLISSTVVHDLLPTTKQLRVLSLSNYTSFSKLPNSIGNLIYLRYLNLSRTMIETLPYATCKLYNLQTLLLSRCFLLTELPKNMGKLVNLRHLDITGTELKEIPVQIVKLKNLQTLSNFLVSSQCNGLKITDLGKFHNLQGKLSISRLQNVNDPSDAFQAHLEMKNHIDELVLDWGMYDTASNSKVQSDILEQLQPSTYLKNLCISGYGGNNFPNWLGDSLFINMVYLKISNCYDCSWMPPLGQLGNLKEIYISNMEAVTRVGTEFYGSNDSPSFQPFPSLEKLTFCSMPKWEEWKLVDGKSTEFPSLKCLSLEKCPKLDNIPRNLPSLTILEFKGCPLLVESGESYDNNNIMRPSSDFVFRLLMLPPLSCLQKLNIDNSPSLTSFQRDSLPKTLKSLRISNCQNLVFLPHESLSNYTSLEDLEISDSCRSMTTFTLGSLPVLKTMCISFCENLKSILIAEDASQQSLSFLRSITIRRCDKLESFSLGGLPAPNLFYLNVQECEKLRSLPQPINTMAGLQEMEILNLPNLQSISKDGLPISLQKLRIGSIGGILENKLWECLNRLSVLRIESGDIVKAMMKSDVPLLPASLVTLCIFDVVEIECLDGKWLQHLTSLQKLEFTLCDKLKSLPKHGLPSSLKVLSIIDCPLLETKLQRKRGKEWRKIAHIPSIVIYDELIT